jgi:hypothetical protein
MTRDACGIFALAELAVQRPLQVNRIEIAEVASSFLVT